MDSSSALSALNSFQPTSSEDILSGAQAKYDIPNLSSRVKALTGITNNLTNSIAAVDPSVTGRTAGSLVTEGQRSALVNREKQPLLTDLNSNNQNLGQAQSSLNTNQSFADQLAKALASDQSEKYSRLKTQYDVSKAAEDTKAAQQLEQQKLAENARQANLSASSSAANNSYLASLLNPNNNPSTSTKAGYAPKNGKTGSGGFSFTDNSGKATSAFNYAQQSGTDFGTLLHQMGQAGDTYAQQAYNQIAANQQYYAKNPQILRSEFKYLF